MRRVSNFQNQSCNAPPCRSRSPVALQARAPSHPTIVGSFCLHGRDECYGLLQAKEFAKVWAEFTLRMDLTLKEYHKHQEWDNIVVTSDLPGVNDEANINSFLSVWKEAEV